MAEIRVLDEQGTTHVFPDGSTPQMIAEALNVKPPDSAPNLQSTLAAEKQQNAQPIPEQYHNSPWENVTGMNVAPLTPDMNTVTSGVKDLAQTAKGIAQIFNPNEFPLGNMLKGYYQSVQASHQASKDAAAKGNTGESMTESAATGLPLLGPLLHGLYGQSGGVGASRALQAASMAPENSAIPNPIGAASELGANAITKGAKVAGNSIAPMMNNYALGTPPKAFRYGKNPGAEVADQGISGTMDSVHQQISDKLASKSAELNNALSSPQAQQMQVDTTPAVGVVDKAIQQAVRRNDPQLYNQLSDLRERLTTQAAPVNGKLVRTPANPQRSPFDVAEMKRGVQDSISWGSGQAFEKPLNAVKKQVQGLLDSQLEQAIPEIKPLNSTVSNLIDAKAAAENKMNGQMAGRGLFRSPELVGGMAAGLSGGAVPAVVAGGAMKIARTTPVLTGAAKAVRGLKNAQPVNPRPLLPFLGAMNAAQQR